MGRLRPHSVAWISHWFAEPVTGVQIPVGPLHYCRKEILPLCIVHIPSVSPGLNSYSTLSLSWGGGQRRSHIPPPFISNAQVDDRSIGVCTFACVDLSECPSCRPLGPTGIIRFRSSPIVGFMSRDHPYFPYASNSA